MVSRPFVGGALALALLAPAACFYLPGVAPHEYLKGDRVELKLNKLASTKTQLPYEWYSLPFCRPEKVEHVAENLGEVLRGDRILNSPYDIRMHVPESCKVLCRMTYSAEQMAEFAHKISGASRAVGGGSPSARGGAAS